MGGKLKVKMKRNYECRTCGLIVECADFWDITVVQGQPCPGRENLGHWLKAEMNK